MFFVQNRAQASWAILLATTPDTDVSRKIRATQSRGYQVHRAHFSDRLLAVRLQLWPTRSCSPNALDRIPHRACVVQIKPAIERELEKFLRCAVWLKPARTREIAREVRHRERVARRERASAIGDFLLERSDDFLWQKSRPVQEVAQILDEVRMPENIVAPRTVSLEYLQVRQPVTADQAGGIGEEFPPR